MFGSVSRLIRNKRGAFAIQFAVLAVPLTVCTGLAIDGGRAFLARFELASALDAAALAVGSTLQTQGTDLNAVAAKFVEKNFRTEHSEPVALSLVSEEDTVLLKGSVKINTFFMPLVGQPTITVNAESEVRRGGSNIEVAMALDITGSMTESRMNGLKAAANILIDEVVNPVQTPFFSKVAVVPWSQSINLSNPSNSFNYVTNTALDELRGGAIIGPRNISAASWRVAGASNLTISEAGWRTKTGAVPIAAANSSGTGGIDWRYGPAVSISSFSKVTVNTSSKRILVTTGAKHNYSTGDFVHITGAGGSYTSLNNNTYRVEYYTSGQGANSNTQFYLRELNDSGYVAQPSGSTSSSATSQRCHDAACNVTVTTTAAFSNLTAGDRVNITGSTGFPSSQSPNYINNSPTTSWAVKSVISSTRFTLDNWNGPNFGASMNAGGGTVSECLEAGCRYRITTNNNHSFSTSDYVAIWGMTESGAGTSAVKPLNTTWFVADPSGKVFYLPGDGNSYRDWSADGYAAKCQLSTCNTRITVGSSTPASTLKVGDLVEVSGVKGMTGINNPSSAVGNPYSQQRYTWKISEINGSVLTLEDTSPAYSNMSGNYTSAGVANCVVNGCARYDFVIQGGTASNYDAHRVYKASPCIVERYGDDAATDKSPADSPLSIYYTSNGSCTRSNYVTPLTSDKQRLEDAIGDLATGGSTSGQLGIAWAWYLLSPNFGDVWDRDPDEMNVPLSYEAPETAKIAILMTDGEFNYATCNNVNTGTSCTPSKTPFQQAEAICAEMKKQDIIIYTVGLELNKAQYSDDFLGKCATDQQHAFLADNNEELEQAFKDIAVSINRLRISR